MRSCEHNNSGLLSGRKTNQLLRMTMAIAKEEDEVDAFHFDVIKAYANTQVCESQGEKNRHSKKLNRATRSSAQIQVLKQESKHNEKQKEAIKSVRDSVRSKLDKRAKQEEQPLGKYNSDGAKQETLGQSKSHKQFSQLFKVNSGTTTTQNFDMGGQWKNSSDCSTTFKPLREAVEYSIALLKGVVNLMNREDAKLEEQLPKIKQELLKLHERSKVFKKR